MISSDQEGLNKAYNNEDGLFEDTNTNTLYIAETRNLKDVSQWGKIPWFKTKESDISNRAKKFLDEHPNITNLSGHSFGGTVALQLQQDEQMKHGYMVPLYLTQYQGIHFISRSVFVIGTIRYVLLTWVLKSKNT